MFKLIAVSVVLCAFVGVSVQEPSRSLSEYTAGVVEYQPSIHADPTRRVQNNLNRYLIFIEDAKEQDVDIIVFPESTLNSVIGDRRALKKSATFVPDPKKHEVPCNNANSPGGAYDQVLAPISCAAKSKKMYVVINISEQEPCTADSQALKNDTRPCNKDALNFYNTDVVLDRSGAVIARYRKYNLFGERNFNTTKSAEHSTFDTDFGVRFGLFTCFDIMFNEPTLGLVREGVKDFIFPTMWFSELPFLTALQIQEYWSYTNDVNLLASGASNTLFGSGGSGIYAGVKGPLVSYLSIPGHDNDKLLVARVPIKGASHKSPADIVKQPINFARKVEPNMDAFRMKRDHIDDYTSELIGEKFSKELCSGELCCTFNVTSEFLIKHPGEESYWYRAIVGDVIRTFSGVANGGIKSCAIVACSGTDIKSCAKRYPFSNMVAPRQIFHSIRIEGDFPAIDEVLTLPNTLRHSMTPLKAGSFAYNEAKSGDKKHVEINLRGLPVKDLQTFGIFGRDFRGDGPTQLSEFTYFQYNVVQTL